MKRMDIDTAISDVIEAIPAPLLLIIAISLLSAGSGFTKFVLNAGNILDFAFVRLALGAVVLWAIARPNILNMSRRQWRDTALLGVVIALFKVADLYALVAMPLGLMVTIGFLGPLAVSIYGASRPVEYVWPFLGFAGVVMLAPLGQSSSLSWQAIGFGLLSALAWGSYIVISARVGRSMRGLEGFAVANVIAAVLLLPLGLSGVSQFFATTGTALVVAAVTLLAILPLGLEFLALKRLSPHVFGVLLSLEPAIASMLGLAILGEQLALLDWVAVATVSAASLGATLFSRRAAVQEA
jgi:inner membrane transporter RhtA